MHFCNQTPCENFFHDGKTRMHATKLLDNIVFCLFFLSQAMLSLTRFSSFQLGLAQKVIKHGLTLMLLLIQDHLKGTNGVVIHDKKEKFFLNGGKRFASPIN